MSESTGPLERCLSDFERCTGKRPSSFYCPILLEESPGVELIDGHILPQSLRSASRATVLQRKDVDNFFGHKIEGALVEFLNSVTYTKAEFLERAKGVQIVSEKAGPLDLFVPSPRSTPPFPKIGLRDSKGNTVAAPHVKGTLDDLGGPTGTAEVRGSMSFHKPSVDAAMLKAAHLALFRIAGYRWPLSRAGQFTAAPLRNLFRSGGRREDVEAIFGGFASAFHVILTGGFPFDTLSDSTVLLHDHLDDPRDVAPFAISCVFAANDRTLLVTLPFSTTDEGFAPCLEEYQALVSDWQRPHRMVRSLLSPDGIEPQSVVRMQYTENPPEELIPPNRSDED